jgi:hypothetical protein
MEGKDPEFVLFRVSQSSSLVPACCPFIGSCNGHAMGSSIEPCGLWGKPCRADHMLYGWFAPSPLPSFAAPPDSPPAPDTGSREPQRVPAKDTGVLLLDLDMRLPITALRARVLSTPLSPHPNFGLSITIYRYTKRMYMKDMCL